MTQRDPVLSAGIGSIGLVLADGFARRGRSVSTMIPITMTFRKR